MHILLCKHNCVFLTISEQEAIAEFLGNMPTIDKEFDIRCKIGEGESLIS